MNLLLGASGAYTFTSGAGAAADYVEAIDGFRARLDFGVDWAPTALSNLTSKIFVDGLGASGQQSIGATLRFDMEF